MIAIKRVYEPYSVNDGYRVLVDRLWPRGLSKAKAHVDLWARDIAPSTKLRKWYEHEPAKWPLFEKRYRQELATPAAKALLAELARRARSGRVMLVYSSHAGDISNAAALERMLKRRVGRTRATVSPGRTTSKRGPRKRHPVARWSYGETCAASK
jgi:uncharacterized protein YeaO (DUF488 family)